MSLRELPAGPNLEHLRNQGRTLRRERLAGDANATQRFTAQGIESGEPKLADALHVIALEYGFATWPALKLHIEMDATDPMEALVAAIKADDASLVRRVLGGDPLLKLRINEPLPKHGFDEPAIISAVHKQNREMVDVLLEFGANINERSRWWAGSFGVLDFANTELSAYLIARGATVDIHSAARLGMVAQVREFLDFNPELVHAQGGDGQLPLHFAATPEIAGLLLDAGANIEARDIDHESTALQYMVSTEPYRHDVAKYLLARGAEADIIAASAVGDLSVVGRILNDDPETVRTTVTDRYFPKQNPKSGGIIYIYGFGFTKTPHMIALQFDHRPVFDLLMQRSPGWLRLIQAAEIGDEVLFRQILEKHPTLFARLTANASRRLIGTAVRNNDRAVKLLVDAGWPVNVAMDNNQTPLHYAAWHGNLAMVQTLLAHQATVNIFETEHGGSPIGWALHGSIYGWHRDRGDYCGVVRALLEAGAQLPQTETPLDATEEVLEIIQQRPS
jgi:ankyrin repeat protein